MDLTFKTLDPLTQVEQEIIQTLYCDLYINNNYLQNIRNKLE